MEDFAMLDQNKEWGRIRSGEQLQTVKMACYVVIRKIAVYRIYRWRATLMGEQRSENKKFRNCDKKIYFFLSKLGNVG